MAGSKKKKPIARPPKKDSLIDRLKFMQRPKPLEKMRKGEKEEEEEIIPS
jgi:hypothetical protein